MSPSVVTVIVGAILLSSDSTVTDLVCFSPFLYLDVHIHHVQPVVVVGGADVR